MRDQFSSAAQYVRMSTEHQQYSLDHQREAIAEYAALHFLTIVQSYEDPAKSGLSFKNRPGLRRLIEDIASGRALFKTILVYDVSRWGRFQDTDEAAYYEFLCKKAGVAVEYCAEPFRNDGTLPSLILKAIKRTMAGEYSRDLSNRVFAGLKKIVELGFSAGGTPHYGLRRLLVGMDGKPKQILRFGERKSIATDRVLLVPGPEEEVRTVRYIFDLILRGKRPTEIARILNRQGIRRHDSQLWENYQVAKLVRNPKYTGDNYWARTTRKLNGPTRRQPREEWIHKPNAFPAIITRRKFQKVQEKIKEWWTFPTDEELLKSARAVFRRRGKFSVGILIEEHKKGVLFSPQLYFKRFGTMRSIYQRIGYIPRPTMIVGPKHRLETQTLLAQLLENIKDKFPTHVDFFHFPGRTRKVVRVDDQFNVSVVVCSYSRLKPDKWIVNSVPPERKFITMLCRLNRQNSNFLDFRVLPSLNIVPLTERRETDYPFSEVLPFTDVSEFYPAVIAMSKRIDRNESLFAAESSQRYRRVSQNCGSTVKRK